MSPSTCQHNNEAWIGPLSICQHDETAWTVSSVLIKSTCQYNEDIGRSLSISQHSKTAWKV